MTAAWNTETVLALAPDPASAKAGRGLAAPAKWSGLGANEGLIWGECQGSGANPYQTKVDPAGPAFSCSCPSRKFPCKHAIGLMLVWTSSPSLFVEAAPPGWVVSWKENREKRAEKAREKVDRGEPAVDLAARAKREASREAKVDAGLDDLSLWLSDLVRQGFNTLGARSGNLWDEQARRMIDAQAPGVARRLRQIDEMALAGDGWQIDLVDRLARLHLLVEAFRRRADAAPEVAADVRATIGFPTDLDLVRAGAGVRDHWQVIGQAVATEDRLTVQRTWLVGRTTKRPALILDFGAGGKPVETTIAPGMVLDAELAFFPGAAPLRALVKDRFAPPEPLVALAEGTTIAEAFAAYGAALSKNPWMELYPVVLDGVSIEHRDESWSVRDASGASAPLVKRFGKGWHLLALGGGGPLTISGEFDGAALNPLGCQVDGKFVPRGCQVDGKFVPMTRRDVNPVESISIARPVAVPLLVEAAASAFVGVDRRPPPAPPADHPIGRAVAGLESREPASRLLAIAAAASLYGRVGRTPPIDASPRPQPCPPDDRPECLPAQADRLRMMLGGVNWEYLNEWMTLLAESGRRLPHDVLVVVLNCQSNDVLPVDVLPRCLDLRGRWLASQNPRWHKYANSSNDPAEAAAAWATAAPAERIAALRSLRRSDPDRARELVVSTFQTEPAARRAAIVAEFAAGLSMADEPFLEAALDDRSKDVRDAAADLLKSLPESRLVLRMIERSAALLAWKPGLLGIGKGSLEIQTPPSCDKSLARDGVPPKPGHRSNLGERAWLLREVLAATPPSRISERLGVSAARIVATGLETEWREALLEGWSVSATRSRDAEWAEALLDASSWTPDAPRELLRDRGLFEILPARRRAEVFQKVLRDTPDPLRSYHPAASLVSSLGDAMTPAIAREVVDRIRRLVDDERAEFADPDRVAKPAGRYLDHAAHNLIKGLADCLPLEMADEIAARFPSTEPPHHPYQSACLAMIDGLTFRRDMHREFAP